MIQNQFKIVLPETSQMGNVQVAETCLVRLITDTL